MKDALVILAHGSRSPAATSQFIELVDAVRQRRGGLVLPAFMELAEPRLPEAVRRAVEEGATEITVEPCFLFDGNHIIRDIPEMVSELAATYPGITFRFGRPLGPDPRIIDVLLDRIGEATVIEGASR